VLVPIRLPIVVFEGGRVLAQVPDAAECVLREVVECLLDEQPVLELAIPLDKTLDTGDDRAGSRVGVLEALVDGFAVFEAAVHVRASVGHREVRVVDGLSRVEGGRREVGQHGYGRRGPGSD
jgi:hypothetical protein